MREEKVENYADASADLAWCLFVPTTPYAEHHAEVYCQQARFCSGGSA